MRNIFVHNYDNINTAEAWNTLVDDIPELKSYCERVLLDMASDTNKSE